MTKGLKTSEFWVTVIMAFIPVLNKLLGLDIDPEVIVGTILPAIAYIWGRSWLKGKK